MRFRGLIFLLAVSAAGCGGAGEANPLLTTTTVGGGATEATPQPQTQHWSGTMASQTKGIVPGNTCTGDYESTFDLTVDPDGKVSGTGEARLQGGIDCSAGSIESVGVSPTTLVRFKLRGTRDETAFLLRLIATSVEGQYTAGFHAFYIPDPRRFRVPLTSLRTAEARFTLRDDSTAELSGGGGSAVAENLLGMSCTDCSQ